VPFGCLLEAQLHTIRYPNGDLTHCFALCFLAEEWRGGPRPDNEESTATRFVELDDLPEPIHPPTLTALELLKAYFDSGQFQIR
jgi:ADP-ribose pyrophosphatase YjhB (NUDIX family)